MVNIICLSYILHLFFFSAFDKLTDYVPEQKVLVNLAAAFIENEEISKAKKVLMVWVHIFI
jgi:hypothetical protein